MRMIKTTPVRYELKPGDYSRVAGPKHKALTNIVRAQARMFMSGSTAAPAGMVCRRLEHCRPECCPPCTSSSPVQYVSRSLFEQREPRPCVELRPAGVAC